MVLGQRGGIKQEMFLTKEQIAKAPSHPFYSRLETVFCQYRFDALGEEVCCLYLAEGIGRLGLPTATSFGCLCWAILNESPACDSGKPKRRTVVSWHNLQLHWAAGCGRCSALR
jgi:hypothetical protein